MGGAHQPRISNKRTVPGGNPACRKVLRVTAKAAILTTTVDRLRCENRNAVSLQCPGHSGVRIRARDARRRASSSIPPGLVTSTLDAAGKPVLAGPCSAAQPATFATAAVCPWQEQMTDADRPPLFPRRGASASDVVSIHPATRREVVPNLAPERGQAPASSPPGVRRSDIATTYCAIGEHRPGRGQARKCASPRARPRRRTRMPDMRKRAEPQGLASRSW
jgi:hypothetical protein